MEVDIVEVKKPFVCQECGKSFWRKFNLQQHFIVHTGEKKFQCGECNKRFAHKSSLNDHVKIHNGTKDHVCVECGKAFYTKSNLKQHIVRHTGEKNYQCPACEKKFGRSSYMLTHAKLHHADEYQRIKYIHQQSSLMRRKLLPKINKSVAQQHPNDEPLNLTLNQVQVNSGIKESLVLPVGPSQPQRMVKPKPTRRPPKEVKLRHECHECGSKFTFKKYLIEHMKVHQKKKTDGRKECTICGKWVTNFHQHMRRHAGVKDHQCPGCKKMFFQKSNLKQHARKRPKTCLIKLMESTDYVPMVSHPPPDPLPPHCIRCHLQFASLFELVAHSHECIGFGSFLNNDERMAFFGGGAGGESSMMSQHEMFNDDSDDTSGSDSPPQSGVDEDLALANYVPLHDNDQGAPHYTASSESAQVSLMCSEPPLQSKSDDKDLPLMSYVPLHDRNQEASVSSQSFALSNLKHRSVVGSNGKKSYPCVRCRQNFNSIVQLLNHSDTNKCSG